ncbi:MAG: GNAT family N-acetyltransferase [Fimbriimonas sp.]
MSSISSRAAEFGSPEWREIVELRRRVLRLPLGLDFTEEELAAERDQIQLGLWEDGRLVACAVVVLTDQGYAKVRQVAVDPDSQGKGYGRQVMALCEAHLPPGTPIRLHARETVVPFYLALGYQSEGDIFEEIGIPHRLMTKNHPTME